MLDRRIKDSFSCPYRRILSIGLALLCLVVQVGCGTVKKEPEPIVGFAIIPPIQYPSRGGKIDANRTSIIYGHHDYVKGFDVSFFGNITEKEFIGTATSLVFNVTRGKTHAVLLQFAGLFNSNTGDANVYGVQLAGLGNFGKTKIYGFQLGLYNESESVYGFQIGLINRTKNLHGVQIGLANMSAKNGLPFCPILNIGF